MRSHLARVGGDILHFIAPSLCPACDVLLVATERQYCGACRASLEPAPFPREIFVELAGRFPGEELAITAIASLYAFEADGPVQRLIHALKYKGCYEIGVELGRELAVALRMFREFETFDLVVPVPLHHARRRERGYNQAEAIARGISRAMDDVPVAAALARSRHTTSQTRLGAEARIGNVAGGFRTLGHHVDDLTILLCDDVCTTGATLNACAGQLLAAGARTVLAATAAKDMEGKREDRRWRMDGGPGSM